MPGQLESLSSLAHALRGMYHTLATSRDTVTMRAGDTHATFEAEVNFLAKFIYDRFRNSINTECEHTLAENYFIKLLTRLEETSQILYRLYLKAGGDYKEWGKVEEPNNDLRLPEYQPVYDDAIGYGETLQEARDSLKALFWEMFPVYDRLHMQRGEGASHEITTAFVSLFKISKQCRDLVGEFPSEKESYQAFSAFLDYIDTLDITPPDMPMDDIGLFPDYDYLPVDSPRMSALIYALEHWGKRNWFDEGPEASAGGMAR